MAADISPQIIPEWAVFALGKNVILTKAYDSYRDGSDVYPVGSIGILDSIQCGFFGPEAVIYLPEDDGLLLNMTFDHLRLLE